MTLRGRTYDVRVIIAVVLMVMSGGGLVATVFNREPTPTPIDRGIEVAHTTYLPIVESAGAAPAIESPAIRRVNEVRAAEGLAPLAVSPELTRAAQAHAEDMRDKNYFSHDSEDGTRWSHRIIAFYPDWRALGKNIAAGYTDEESLVAGWLNSPGHYANIVSTEFSEVGIGHATGGYYGHYWVADFGRKGTQP